MSQSRFGQSKYCIVERADTHNHIDRFSVPTSYTVCEKEIVKTIVISIA